MNRSVTGCVPAPGSDLSGPRLVGPATHTRAVSVWSRPARGPSRRDCPGSGVSASAPTAAMTISISFCTPSCLRSDPRGSQSGHLPFPPYYLPCLTVPDSSSNFWSSNFWSNPTTFVGSPPLPRKEYPRSRVPNCSGDGGPINNTLCLYDVYYITLLLTGGLFIPH